MEKKQNQTNNDEKRIGTNHYLLVMLIGALMPTFEMVITGTLTLWTLVPGVILIWGSLITGFLFDW